MPNVDAYVASNFTRFPYVKKGPNLVAIHDFTYLDHPEVVEVKNLKYLSKHVPKSVSESDVIIATSQYTNRELSRHFPLHPPVITVSNAVSKRFKPPQLSEDRENYILAVGTLEPRKNLLRLAEAYTNLPEDVQTRHPLVITGSSGWGDISSNATSNRNITFTGYVDDEKLINLYANARLFTFPSIYEGFGLPLLEAMTSNTPVACSDIPPFRDIGGESVSYFDHNSVDSIRKTLLYELSSPAPSRRIEDARQIAQSYTWTSSAQGLLSAINTAIKLNKK